MNTNKSTNLFFGSRLIAGGVVKLLLVLLGLLIVGCNDSGPTNERSAFMVQEIRQVSVETQQALEKIRTSRLFFSHKSVGYNILTGVQEIAEESGVELSIRKIGSEAITEKRLWAHSAKGENGKPKSKIDEFYRQIRQMTDFVPQVAFMKLCYVDVMADTDVEKLFEYYRGVMGKLETERPETSFIHFTVPLQARSSSLKDRIKRLLGLPTWSDASNIKRTEFNNLLLAHYPGDAVFDIALIESTRPDGSREQFFSDDKVFYGMSPLYTDDGGHLNAQGRRTVAHNLVMFLANTLNRKREHQQGSSLIQS